MLIVLLSLAALALAALGTYRFSRPGSAFHILDLPTHRSLHTRPVPRGGGVAVVGAALATGTVAAVVLGAPPVLGWITAGAALVAFVSFLDDRHKLPVRVRFPVHLAATALLLAGGLTLRQLQLPGATVPLPLVAGAVLTILYAGWMLNLYNFMDGMDGNAGGMAVIGFATFAGLGWLAGEPLFAAVAACIAGAAAGFLVFNFPPARIFMGDAGSSTLGFLAAALSLWAAREGLFPLWIAVLVFSPFIVDATVTLVRRTARGERPWEAHRDHYYQRLVQLGLGHRGTALREYALMAACGASALAAVRAEAGIQALVLGGWAVAYTVLVWVVGRLHARSGAMGPDAARRPRAGTLDAEHTRG